MSYILTLNGKESEGAYAVSSSDGGKILQIFEELDDAQRYIGLLEAEDYPHMAPYEIECEQAIAACENFGYNYTIITKDDIVIPPQEYDYDFI